MECSGHEGIYGVLLDNTFSFSKGTQQALQTVVFYTYFFSEEVAVKRIYKSRI